MSPLSRIPPFSLLGVCGALILFAWTRPSAAEFQEGTLRAGEGMLVSLPLDTGSVLNGGYPIDSLGYVDLPVMGKLFVDGLDPERVEDTLSRGLAQYLRDTHVRVRPATRLTLLGHWQRPGMHYVEAGATVWEACRLVGGPAGEVNLRKWKVMRGKRDLSLQILDAFSQGASLSAAGVQSGDIFIIPVPNPQSGFWYGFRETLAFTAQIAAITATVLTTYLTYTFIDNR